MTENDRFRTLLNRYVRKSAKSLSDMHYNMYTHFVHKVTPCHEYLLTAGSPHWNRPLKISAGKLKQPVLQLNLSA
ncbi:hypothetical protein QF20_004934 [Salmonella enterica subsp. enterica]|uniref:Uncharacterized protein n=2 Tax=Salmonella enterica TaxID=28901 RepID=A0A750EDN5_SALER|nr:hypothetical protein [Salmonella enterica subsp. enterica serovar Mikawasima]EAZ0195548.1 hypothetical protein [Salmonella enterica]EBV2340887.1 hypothetical protein [Salmonella enterica subsp. enterica serovar Potsdam]EBY1555634.1 hypothetical protein [Salmonella enterica subsp. enterica serovar Hofit]ECV7438438.1 hypothetical protein [Salmonella enterica subsp. enterica serovar Newport]